MPLADELRKIVKGEVLDTPQALDAVSRDASLFRVVPKVVVRPKDTADIKALVRLVTEKKKAGEHISLTVRSGGTDMSGGPLNDSIIVDMLHFNKILEVHRGETSLHQGYAVVEPGVYFRDFDKETKKKNLELPSYTASREICTVGGMVANDSGGEKNLKYGKTARYVEELEVVMADGEVHTLKNWQGLPLTRKLAEQSFEGEVYRAITNVLQNYGITIEEAKPVVTKNSSGYALWDIGDGTDSLNLARLMTGAQGTLGIITKIKFRLVRPKPYASMLVIFLKDLADLGPFVPEILTAEPDSVESYDDHTFSLAIKYFPELASQMSARGGSASGGKTSLLGLGISLLPEMLMLATGGVPKLVILVEFRSDSQAEALAKAEALRATIDPFSKTESMHIARDERAARKYWAIRREAFNLLRKKVRGKKTAPFIDDFVVPPAVLPEFLPKLRTILDARGFTYAVTGHVGDGNFHIFPLLDPNDPGTPKLIDELSHQVYELVLSYHGSITGEHNDGLIRTPYIEKMFGPAMQKLFDEVNHILDPLDIFNPGKKVHSTFADVMKHFDF
jgi:FAD/FMN-containing dehydrogenase